MVQDVDSKAVAAVAAAEEGSQGDVIFKAAVVEAEGGIIIKDTTSQEIIRGTVIMRIIKKISNSKVTSTIIVITTVKVGIAGLGLPGDKVIRIQAAILGVIQTKDTTLNRSQLDLAHWAIPGLAGAIMCGLGAGETPSLLAP